MSLIGIDVGTTGCKVIAFNESGEILSRHSHEYKILTPQPGWAEQDINLVWALVWDSLIRVVSDSPQDPPRAIALSVQGEAVVPVNANGDPLRPAILGMDNRTNAENEWIIEQFGKEEIYKRTGMPVHTVNSLPKILWLKNNEPKIWNDADQILLYEDFFVRRLCGIAKISHCLASRTQMYNLSEQNWDESILNKSGIDCEKLATLSPPEGGVIGGLSEDLTDRLGIKTPVYLCSGGHDQACAAFGSGVVKPGSAMVSTGTAEVIEVATGSSSVSDKLLHSNIAIYRHVIPGLFLAMTLNHSGGLLLRWFRDNFSKFETKTALTNGRDPYEAILDNIPDGPTDIMVLPHFSGSGTPVMDISSKGAILGLTFNTSHATVAKAILEGVTFELRSNFELLKESGFFFDNVNAVGGGAKSSKWNQLKADICQVPLRIPVVTEAACLGAALLAGVGIDLYSDHASAVKNTVQVSETFYPNKKLAQAYTKRFQVHQSIYPALIGIHRQL